MQNLSLLPHEDTICAISTPIGEGAIGIVRLSGKDAFEIAGKIFKAKNHRNLIDFPTHTIHYGFIFDPLMNSKIDNVLLSVMRSPNTYTREDIVEINCHGGRLVLSKIINLLTDLGARLAEPGEFTKRAFLNGRIDLAQAESVIDIIRSKSDLSLKAAMRQLEGSVSDEINNITDALLSILSELEVSIDFPEEEMTFPDRKIYIDKISDLIKKINILVESSEKERFIKEGVYTSIIGRPNVGKSSLLNRLIGKERAIVTSMPGTTRDSIEEFINIQGLPLRLIDTAGIRRSDDLIENEGIRRSYIAMDQADLILLILDISEALAEEDYDLIKKTESNKRIVILNKRDKEARIDLNLLRQMVDPSPVVEISVVKDLGLDKLVETILEVVIGEKLVSTEGYVLVNARHRQALTSTASFLNQFLILIKDECSPEILSSEIRNALDTLGEITGRVTIDGLLDKIFSEFCIGK